MAVSIDPVKRANSLANLSKGEKINESLRRWREENPDWRIQSAASPAKQLGWKVRKETRAGAEIIEYLLGVMRDEGESTKARLQASQMLLDRGWGKAVDTIKMLSDTSAAGNDKTVVAAILDKLDPGILDALQNALASRDATVTMTVQHEPTDEDGFPVDVELEPQVEAAIEVSSTDVGD